jgi:hypothetical protein
VAKTVAEAFEVLLSRIPPSEAVTETARRHRQSIEDCLRANCNVQKFMPVGSFGHGTNIPRFSDIDFFLVTPEDELSTNSPTALRQVKTVLARRFWATDVRVSSPAVLVPFGGSSGSSSERFEITPAFADNEDKGVYWIPDGAKDWMLAAPREHHAYINRVNDQLNKRAKRLIRLAKLWNGLSHARMKSIYIELRVARGSMGSTRSTTPSSSPRPSGASMAPGWRPCRIRSATPGSFRPVPMRANLRCCRSLRPRSPAPRRR